jgi:hypothetical protein
VALWISICPPLDEAWNTHTEREERGRGGERREREREGREMRGGEKGGK